MKGIMLWGLLGIMIATSAQAGRTDCNHYCNGSCQDAIEQYEDEVDGCTNGAPSTGPVPGQCAEVTNLPAGNSVRAEYGCENGAGCVVFGKLFCGLGWNQRPTIPNLQGTGGISCPERYHSSGVFLPSVIVKYDNGICQYPDGTFIAWTCDAAGTGIDVFYGQHF